MASWSPEETERFERLEGRVEDVEDDLDLLFRAQPNGNGRWKVVTTVITGIALIVVPIAVALIQAQ